MDIPNTSLGAWIEKTAGQFPDRPAFYFQGRSWTFRELMENGRRFAATLQSHGLRKGDVLAVHLVNCPQYLMALIAALQSGIVVTGVSPLLTSEEIAFQLSDTGARAVITLNDLFESRLAPIAPDLDALALIIRTDPTDVAGGSDSAHALPQMGDKKVLRFSEMISGGSPLRPGPDVNPGDVAFIQYTGGTTGSPKGAMLTHANLAANIAQLTERLALRNGEDTLLCPFPMFHIAGLLHALKAMALSMTQIVVPDPRDMERILHEWRQYRPTFVASVPALCLMFLQERGFRELDFSALRTCMFGAAPFPADKVMELEQVIGPGKAVSAYGMTETGPLQTVTPRGRADKTGSVGTPLPETRLKLMDLDSGKHEVPPGEEGEVAACGPQVMKGYLNRPVETREALRRHDDDLWMHTGDVGRLDDDGFLFIVDRIKDMINVGGYKVFSSEVEHKFYKHEAVQFCALIGIPDLDRPGNEKVKLVVQKSDAFTGVPDDRLRQDLIGFARERMAPYKVPKVVEFVEPMPLTSVGKVDKKALR
ncbi:MAG: AMP-binding protein [Deltaproteobacteria bacterium]|nr:AMP-binding protein [Deltaproteobacteria bacterium]